MNIPAKYIEEKPTPQTVELAGVSVNLRRIAEDGFNHSYISYILRGERNPSARYAKQLACALGMTVDELLDVIDARITHKKKYRKSA